MSWQPLIANLALIAIVMIAFDGLAGLTARWRELPRSLIFGILMGGGAILSMGTIPTPIPGVLVDLRVPFVASAGFFGGLPAALASTAMSVAFRASLGGAGMFSGITSLVLGALVGIAGYVVLRRRPRSFWHIVVFASVLAGTNLASFFLLPEKVFDALFAPTLPPFLLLNFAGSLVIGTLFGSVMRRRALERTNMIYRSMVEQLPDSLIFKDMDGRFVIANQATARSLNRQNSEDLVGLTDFDVHPKELAERYRQDELQILRSNEMVRHDEPFISPTGEKGWLSTLKVPLKDESGRLLGIITYNRDVTEERRIDEAKQEFIAVVSHELRTPLTSIRGALSLIKAGAAGVIPPKAAKLVEIGEANAFRLILLVNDILDFEKLDSGKMTFDIDDHLLHPLLEQAISAHGEYLPEKRVRIVFENDQPSLRVLADGDRLHQVMANLLSNALKFLPFGGCVTVGVAAKDGWVRVSVHDEGPGIPAAFQQRVFNKLEQAAPANKRETGGTGLGLSIAKLMMEKMNGCIGFGTGPDSGTTFSLYLPAGGSLPESIPSAAASGHDPSHELPQVLILDDDEEIREAFSTLLAGKALVVAARSLAEARESTQRRPADLILLDIWLPDGSGHVLLNELFTNTPVIVFSNVPVDLHMRRRVVEVISKEETPIEEAALRVSAVLALIDRGRSKSEETTPNAYGGARS